MKSIKEYKKNGNHLRKAGENCSLEGAVITIENCCRCRSRRRFTIYLVGWLLPFFFILLLGYMAEPSLTFAKQTM